ncbi:class I SAM-dependent methyltransferase [Gracilibacillus dipsosauri]|uniref:Uncharacterized methyltransferase DLJ74_18215 n=1 Tax=Gracilibacillus dipsosauri TaxID=178340 RepID=A0A317KWI3_9BACI|nr:class I SAM-dependent methyltransferase [Gracilibacillus dipsosauri]PWU66808.1 methyltransferase domain-containing protein [Gracilibacillus dipsosauri]
MGREFLDVFEEWASSYDDAVTGNDPQYRDVFEGYDTILNEVAKLTVGNVLEFGVGTGNLSAKLIAKGHTVFGIEPSDPMRELAQKKFPQLDIKDGDFLQYHKPAVEINTIVSTYAFHHLTDEEKNKAITQFYEILADNGRIVFADTVYKNQAAKQKLHQEAEANEYTDLLHDLQTEYYPFLQDLKVLFTQNGFQFEAKQCNKYVWLIMARKQ